MTALHQYISAIGSFQGLLLFVLLVCDRHTAAASKVLGCFCLAMGLAFFIPFITFGVAAEGFNRLAVWLFFLPVMYGPLLYLYCSKVVFNAPLRLMDSVHALPLIACYLLNFDALIHQHEAFRNWIVGAQPNTYRVWLSEYVLFATAFVYLVATLFLLKRYHRQAANNLSNFNPAVFQWLGLLVSAFIVIWATKAVMAFSNFATLTMLIISDALIVLMIYVIALTQWKAPHFFMLKAENNAELMTAGHAAIASTARGGVLDQDTRVLMFEKVKHYVERHHAYRNSELSLTMLASAVGLSPHHLSEVLNQHAGQNFNQFVNAYRVQEVCEQLDSNTSVKVLDVALKAGFSSKSTFNTLFKKFTGVTPTQYRLSR